MLKDNVERVTSAIQWLLGSWVSRATFFLLGCWCSLPQPDAHLQDPHGGRIDSRRLR